MRNDSTIGRGGAGIPRPALALLLCGTALFLAVENAVLLLVFGPALPWPAELEPVALVLRVGRVLALAFAPWLTATAAAALAAAGVLWAALRLRREVNHA